MSLKDDIIADVDAVYLNPEEFADDAVLRYVKGASPGIPIKAVVVEDALEGTREVPGDGRVLHDKDGMVIRESITLEVPESQEINKPTEVTGENPDRFMINGKMYSVKRVTGGDIGMKSVLVVRTSKKVTRQASRNG